MIESKTSLYDFAESLKTPEKMATYLEVCIQESDGVSSLIVAKSFGDIVRPRRLLQFARDTPVSRASFFKALSGDRRPNLT